MKWQELNVLQDNLTHSPSTDGPETECCANNARGSWQFLRLQSVQNTELTWTSATASCDNQHVTVGAFHLEEVVNDLCVRVSACVACT